MSDYEDAIENLEGVVPLTDGLRLRGSVRSWECDQLSLSSDVPGLHEVKVLFQYYFLKHAILNAALQIIEL